MVGLTAIAAAPSSEDHFVQEVQAFVADQVPRRSHVDPPTPGTFGELADPFLRQLAACKGAVEARDAAGGALTDGDWTSEAAKCGPVAEGVLRATRADKGELPRPLTLFGIFDPPPGPYSIATVTRAAHLAKVRIEQAAKIGQTGRALELCADGMALARDISHSCLIGQMGAATAVDLLQPACLTALGRASAPQLQVLRAQLLVIREGWAPASKALDEERLFSELGPFYDSLSEETKRALPPGSRIVTSSNPPDMIDRLAMSVLGATEREAHVQKLLAMANATKGSSPAAVDEEMTRIDSKRSIALSIMTSGEPTDFTRFLARVRRTQARLVLLDAAAQLRAVREALGRWPATWAEAGREAPVDARTGLPFQLKPSGTGVAIVPVADGERTKEDLSLTLN